MVWWNRVYYSYEYPHGYDGIADSRLGIMPWIVSFESCGPPSSFGSQCILLHLHVELCFLKDDGLSLWSVSSEYSASFCRPHPLLFTFSADTSAKASCTSRAAPRSLSLRSSSLNLAEKLAMTWSLNFIHLAALQQ